MPHLKSEIKKENSFVNKNLVISAGIISSATLCSRILGFIRDMIIAGFFGTGMSADAFFVAFRLPNLLRKLLGEGALSSSFIPVFTEYLHKKNLRQTWELVSNVINSVVIILCVSILGFILFAPFIIKLLAPGFTHSPEKFHLTTLLARVLFPYILFIGLSALSMGILNSLNHFLVPALTPALLNIAMIFGVCVLSPRLDPPIMGLVIGVLLGGLAQLLFQFPILLHKGFTYSFTLNHKHEGLRKIGKLMLPSTLGLAVAEINSMVDTLLATLLPEGSVSYLYYGNRLIQFPLGLFGIAVGTAILPTLSAQAAKKELSALKETFSLGLRLVMFITLPATFGLIICRHLIIYLLFQRGAFSTTATQATAFALLCYAVGLFAYAGVKVVVPVFYSLQDTVTPVRIAIVSMTLNIVLNIILMKPLKHGGLALATAFSSMINLFFLLFYLRKKIGKLHGRKIATSCIKIFFASTFMGIGTWLLVKQSNYLLTSRTLAGIYLLINIIISALLYAIISFYMKSTELSLLIDIVRKKSNL